MSEVGTRCGGGGERAIDRRQVALGLCACALAPRRAGAGQAKVASLKQIKGCFVDRDNANLVLGSRMVSGDLAGLPEEVRSMMRTTGNPNLDVIFDAALQRLAQTFGVWPKVGFYDDGDEPNAIAVRYDGASGPEFAVVFGRNYFTRLYAYDPSGITILQTAAHEFAHVWVYQSGKFEQVRGGQPTVKRVELHADFLSGYYLGIRKRDNPQASFWAAGIRRWQSGDNELRNLHHHGTPDERLAAAEAGFKLGYQDNVVPKDAFGAATAYVARL